MKTCEFQPGDVVRLRHGTATGEVLKVHVGPWSNGGVPLVSVHWHPRPPFVHRYKSRHTATQLVKA